MTKQDQVFEPLQNNTNSTNQASQEEEEYPFFNGPWLSLVKVTTMFIGELEFSDLPIDRDSALAPATFSFLVFFVLVMVITLMNLLNGLAVSDVGKLEENAELTSFNSRCKNLQLSINRVSSKTHGPDVLGQEKAMGPYFAESMDQVTLMMIHHLYPYLRLSLFYAVTKCSRVRSSSMTLTKMTKKDLPRGDDKESVTHFFTWLALEWWIRIRYLKCSATSYSLDF